MKALIAYGTRPEKIKLDPVATALEDRGVEVLYGFTRQSPDLMAGLAAQCKGWKSIQDGIACVVKRSRFDDIDVVIVEGDTASAFAYTLAAFLAEIPVAHVEAGLRTYKNEPWPEEAFRRMIAPMARWHFAPDERAAINLIGEGIPDERIYVVGNTVIDTLPQRGMNILVTLHRRENWGRRIQNALDSIAALAKQHYDMTFHIVKHPNWSQQDLKLPDSHTGLYFCEPLPREDLLNLLRHTDLVVTDSGGLQEESAHFGVPCIVYRTSTERTALVDAGAVELCNPDHWNLYEAIAKYWNRRHCYGSGDAAERIASVLVNDLERG